MGAGRLEHGQAVIGCPLEQVTKIVAVGVEGPAAVAGQERHRDQLGLAGYERPDGRVQFRREVEDRHL